MARDSGSLVDSLSLIFIRTVVSGAPRTYSQFGDLHRLEPHDFYRTEAHSFRRAITGLTREARRAGTKQAKVATNKRVSETPMSIGR